MAFGALLPSTSIDMCLGILTPLVHSGGREATCRFSLFVCLDIRSLVKRTSSLLTHSAASRQDVKAT